jgi:uncharacterized membrane protein
MTPSPRPPRPIWTDEDVDRVLGRVLQIGVSLSAAIVLCGGVIYLARRIGLTPDYRVFHGEPIDLRTVSGILADARAGSGRGLIQLGLLVLIATPIARVVFSVIGFVRQRDWLYVGITIMVLVLLAGSLMGLEISRP